ncbi:MAG: 6,7-dimethyl-8-ribityllumazine synthase [Bacteroidota bacterium]|jgi:6,7-dimethyl-8-ribityllumazine synthase
MSVKKKNLSKSEGADVPDAAGMRFGVVISEWNHEITGALFSGVLSTLQQYNVDPDHIVKKYVPGSFELTLGAQWILENTTVDAVICLGCVIQGETRHFDFICDAVANGITNLNIRFSKPVIFGVLTPDNMAQAKARAGGKHGNKGVEAAVTAIKMLALKKSFNEKSKRGIGF